MSGYFLRYPAVFYHFRLGFVHIDSNFRKLFICQLFVECFVDFSGIFLGSVSYFNRVIVVQKNLVKSVPLVKDSFCVVVIHLVKLSVNLGRSHIGVFVFNCFCELFKACFLKSVKPSAA